MKFGTQMDMIKCRLTWLRLQLLWLGLAAFPTFVQAQYFFNIPGDGDLLAGFRKTGAHQGTNELVVYLGNVTNLLALPLGSTITMSNIPPARLTEAFSSDYTYLQWSVFGASYELSSPWSTPLGNFPQSTLWYTLPRTNASIPTLPRSRFATSAQAEAATSINSIGNGANTISTQLPGGTNADNNTVLVREPFQQTYQAFDLTTFMGDSQNPVTGDLGGNVFDFNIEQITPNPFSTSVRSDLYESAPAPSSRPPTPYVDPVSGSSSSVYYVGYFDLSPAGVLTFTRDAGGSTPPPPPPAPMLSINRNGNINTVSFGTTSGATYTLLYTNFAGLTSALGDWPTLGSPVPGTGGAMNFTDTTTDPGRVYSVIAH